MTPSFMAVLDLLIRMILIYYIAIHGIYFILIILGAFEQKKFHQAIQFREFKRISESPLTPPVSIVISAYNEEMVIVHTLLNVLQLRYPQFEVVVVNDGSEDGTLQLLIDTFQLEPFDKVFRKQLQTKPVRGVYKSAMHANLIVVDKENGRRADANNTGVDHARYPIICQIDADCVLEQDALLYMIRPFLYNSKVVAAAAMIRPSNGLVVEEGRIISRDLPDRWLPLFQAVEYLRSFQWARLGLTRIRSMLCMSGAFTVIRKEVFIALGGANTSAVVDDFELTVTLHRYIHEHKEARDFEITYIPDPGCYTQVPETLKAFRSQRNFWQRAILQSLIWNRDMAFNPRYGMAGMFGVPFYFIFEAMSAVVESGAYIIAVLVLLLRIDSPVILLLLFVFGVVLGSLVSICAILLQATTRMRVEKPRDLIRLLLAGIVDHLGFHQYHVFCRLVGIYDLLIRHKTVYGYRERTEYKSSS
ncbi:MAG: glycosyltransferase family 2 protein [Chlorobiaceae bacterium]|nr:glycosyltransferase family 2 protein [Chlorobiaceae bacterium]